jgi:hypothetical protein
MKLIQQSHRKLNKFDKNKKKNSIFIFRMNTISQPIAISRSPVVRFVDDPLRTKHLTCIQNVLTQNKNNNNHISTPIGSRKQFLRSKSTHMKYIYLYT